MEVDINAMRRNPLGARVVHFDAWALGACAMSISNRAAETETRYAGARDLQTTFRFRGPCKSHGGNAGPGDRSVQSFRYGHTRLLVRRLSAAAMAPIPPYCPTENSMEPSVRSGSGTDFADRCSW